MLGPICLLLALLLSAGCRSGSTVPDGWAVDVDVSPPAAAWRPEAQIERDREPRLQVFIHYSRTHSTHTTIRVTTPGAPAVFWDPGGAYGRAKPSYGRTHDIILSAPPDLPTWWTYRQRWLNEPFLYVFEWDLEPAQAQAMQKALLDGAANGRRSEVFQTLRTPGFCVIAVCDFLRTYGPPHISPRLHRNFLPNTLANQLWRQDPDRVLRYEGGPDATPVVLMRVETIEQALAARWSEPPDTKDSAKPESDHEAEARAASPDGSPGL